MEKSSESAQLGNKGSCDVENKKFELQIYVIYPFSIISLLTQNDNAVVSKRESTPRLN